MTDDYRPGVAGVYCPALWQRRTVSNAAEAFWGHSEPFKIVFLALLRRGRGERSVRAPVSRAPRGSRSNVERQPGRDRTADARSRYLELHGEV
jgi:hypothetical protein